MNYSYKQINQMLLESKENISIMLQRHNAQFPDLSGIVYDEAKKILLPLLIAQKINKKYEQYFHMEPQEFLKIKGMLNTDTTSKLFRLIGAALIADTKEIKLPLKEVLIDAIFGDKEALRTIQEKEKEKKKIYTIRAETGGYSMRDLRKLSLFQLKGLDIFWQNKTEILQRLTEAEGLSTGKQKQALFLFIKNHFDGSHMSVEDIMEAIKGNVSEDSCDSPGGQSKAKSSNKRKFEDMTGTEMTQDQRDRISQLKGSKNALLPGEVIQVEEALTTLSETGLGRGVASAQQLAEIEIGLLLTKHKYPSLTSPTELLKKSITTTMLTSLAKRALFGPPVEAQADSTSIDEPQPDQNEIPDFDDDL